MSEKNTVIRSLHDLGLAAWFGGSLMGAVGLNGAAAEATDPRERLALSASGWGRWAPVSIAAIALHGIGGIGLISANRARVATQPGARANTVLKTALTVAAAGLTAYSGVLGRKVAQKSGQGGVGATEPAPGADRDLASAQRQLRGIQWAIPVATGAVVLLASQQGEQQRPQSLLLNQLARVSS